MPTNVTSPAPISATASAAALMPGVSSATALPISIGRNWFGLVLVIIPVITILGNLLVILSVLRFRALHSAINFLILGLAVADLLVALFVMPYAVYVYIYNGEWFLGNLMCDIYMASDVACSTASILLLAVISFDRYRAVSRPIQYSRQAQNIKRVVVILVGIWLISLTIASPIVFGVNLRPEDASPTECRFYNAEFSIVSSIVSAFQVSFVLPCVLVLFVYARIIVALKARERAARERRMTNALVTGGGGGAQQASSTSRQGTSEDGDEAGRIVAGPVVNVMMLALPSMTQRMKTFERHRRALEAAGEDEDDEDAEELVELPTTAPATATHVCGRDVVASRSRSTRRLAKEREVCGGSSTPRSSMDDDDDSLSESGHVVTNDFVSEGYNTTQSRRSSDGVESPPLAGSSSVSSSDKNRSAPGSSNKAIRRFTTLRQKSPSSSAASKLKGSESTLGASITNDPPSGSMLPSFLRQLSRRSPRLFRRQEPVVIANAQQGGGDRKGSTMLATHAELTTELTSPDGERSQTALTDTETLSASIAANRSGGGAAALRLEEKKAEHGAVGTLPARSARLGRVPSFTPSTSSGSSNHDSSASSSSSGCCCVEEDYTLVGSCERCRDISLVPRRTTPDVSRSRSCRRVADASRSNGWPPTAMPRVEPHACNRPEESGLGAAADPTSLSRSTTVNSELLLDTPTTHEKTAVEGSPAPLAISEDTTGHCDDGKEITEIADENDEEEAEEAKELVGELLLPRRRHFSVDEKEDDEREPMPTVTFAMTVKRLSTTLTNDVLKPEGVMPLHSGGSSTFQGKDSSSGEEGSSASCGVAVKILTQSQLPADDAVVKRMALRDKRGSTSTEGGVSLKKQLSKNGGLAVRLVKKTIKHEQSLKRKVSKSARKEKRATKTLGIVVGIFLICWVPFFSINILNAVCILLKEERCQVGYEIFFYCTWLGYMNSFMNPIIYTIFNTEFRRAFKSLVFGRRGGGGGGNASGGRSAGGAGTTGTAVGSAAHQRGVRV